MSDTRFCHPDFGCDCADRIAELEKAVAQADRAVSDVHNLVYEVVAEGANRHRFSEHLWGLHYLLRPVLPDDPDAPAAAADVDRLLEELHGGFPEASVAAEGLVAGCVAAVEERREDDRR